MNVAWTVGSTQAAVNAVRAFWFSLGPKIPAAYSLTVDPTIELHDMVTGDLTGTETAATAPAVVAATGATAWAAGVGGRMDWLTGSVAAGHRIRGRTYVVPLITSAYAADGTLSDADVTSFTGYGTTLISALTTGNAPLSVWTRISPKTTSAYLTNVTSARFADQVSVLRGRRV
jgi:hypothetical protein